MTFYFRVTDSENEPFGFKLEKGQNIIIGRKGDTPHLGLNDPLCSSRHCKILVRQNEVYIEDLNSKNGVFLNGIKITRQRVYLDDVIKIGNSLIFVDTNRIDEKVKLLLTYTGNHSRENGSITLELKSEHRKRKQESSDRGRKSNSNNLKNHSSFKKKKSSPIIETIAAISIFLLTLSAYKFIYSEEAALLLKQNQDKSLFLLRETSGYLVIAFIVSIGVFYLVRKLKRKILKLP